MRMLRRDEGESVVLMNGGWVMRWHHVLIVILLVAGISSAGDPPRARDLGIPFEGRPGPLNAITDVAGVTVGHTTLVEDLDDGRAVRTGVTAVLPRGGESLMRPVFGAWFALNGNGEMTGTTWLEESGQLEGPVMITNTHSVGTVHQATIDWRIRQGEPDATGYWWALPVVAETWDGYLNDINGFHVKAEHVDAALNSAAGGPVAEGNVGGGTGMVCYEFKGGIGTASRVVEVLGESYTVGVLVQANYGIRDQLRIAGVPVGKHLRENRVYTEPDPNARESGSIIIVVATDAPLLPHQLKRIARRAALGLGRVGSIAGNGSGDIFVAFSTADELLGHADGLLNHRSVPNDEVSSLFGATVEAVEESIVNALVAARDMTGDQGHYVNALPHDPLMEILALYGR
jgi:D-aminopeptidase